MAAQDLSILPQGAAGGLVGVLDVGGRSAQCSIIDTAGTEEVRGGVPVWNGHVFSVLSVASSDAAAVAAAGA